MTNSVKISTHEKINEKEITFFNDYKIDEFYDLDNPKKGTISIVNLTNSFIVFILCLIMIGKLLMKT
jgi:hypothetical protein